MAKWLNCCGQIRTNLRITKLLLFLTILLTPLYVVRFKVGGYPSTLLEVLIGLTVVAWAMHALTGGKFKVPARRAGRRRSKFKVTVGQWPAATMLFLAAAAISVVVSPDKRGALGTFKAYFIEPILIFFIIRDVVKSKKDWWLVFSALVLSGLWIALLAVFQGLTGQFTFAPHEAALGRAHAVYNTANAVGLYLGPIIVLLLGMLVSNRRQKLKTQNSKLPPDSLQTQLRRSGRGKTTTQSLKLQPLTLFAIIVMILAVLLSRSTGALVGLTVALLVPIAYCLLPSAWRKWMVRGIEVVGALVLIVGIWFFFNISNFTPKNVDPYVRKSTDTLQFRLCLWEGTRNMLLDRPIFGSGLSGFKELYSQKYFTCDAEPLEYPHNWVLNFWVETGLLGLIGFIWILWVNFKKIGHHLSNSRNRWLALGFSAAMIYWLIHGLADVPYFKNDLSLEFWVIVGLAETLGLAL